MPQKQRVALLSTQPNRLIEWKRELQERYDGVPIALQGTANEVLKQLRARAAEITGTATGRIDFDYVVTDASFEVTRGKEIRITDPLLPDLPDRAVSLLSLFLGAGIPVLVSDDKMEPSLAWTIGAEGGELISRGHMSEQLVEAELHLRFSRHTLQVENEFAPNYDEIELAGAGTVSAIISENNYALTHIRTHLLKATTPARILDLGCGTGRFEELLLTDPMLSERIAEIIAVDFAPQYLCQARKRLEHFVPRNELSKVVFLRRIAESLQWPSDYFDIVLASFGIVCFSRAHLTLQQIRTVLRPKGLALINGYNRLALTYEFDQLMTQQTGSAASHFAIHINRDTNKMDLGTSMIDCFTFDLDGIQTLLNIIGLKPIANSAATFPTLYGSARKNYLQELGKYMPTHAIARAHDNCLRRGVCGKFASYQEVNLARDMFKSGFNPIVHQIDGDIAPLVPNRGFYFTVAAHK